MVEKKKKKCEKLRGVKTPRHAAHCPDDPSHFLTAEGWASQQLSPSYRLPQLSNICSLDLTDEREASDDRRTRMRTDPA